MEALTTALNVLSHYQTPTPVTWLLRGDAYVHSGLCRQIADLIRILAYFKLMAWGVPTPLFQPRQTYCCQ